MDNEKREINVYTNGKIDLDRMPKKKYDMLVMILTVQFEDYLKNKK